MDSLHLERLNPEVRSMERSLGAFGRQEPPP